MDREDLPQWQTRDRDSSPDPDPDAPALGIIVIPRVQMPEDLRSEFLPGDVILINEPRPTSPAAKQPLSEARRRLTAVTPPGCPWCKVEDVCIHLITTMAVFAWLGVRPTSVLFAILMLYIMPLGRDPSATRGGRAAGASYHGIGACCSRDVAQHWLAAPARWVLSPSTLVLLQKPVLNLRSLVRSQKFWTGTGGAAAPGFEEEVDGCMRYYCTPGGRLPRAALGGGGTQALLRLERYGDRSARGDLGFLWGSPLYQNYRDWKRWRLANVVCERVQEGGNRPLPLIVKVGGHDPVARLEGGRGDHMWLLVRPKLFSSRLYREVDD